MKFYIGALLSTALLCFAPEISVLEKIGGCIYYPGGSATVGGVTRHTPGFYECGSLGHGGAGSGRGRGFTGNFGGADGRSPCALLLATRPRNCANKAAMPSGIFYGPGYNPGTAMDILTNFASASVTKDAFPTVRGMIRDALAIHTRSIVAGGSFLDVTANLGAAIDSGFSELPEVVNSANSYYARRNTFQFCDAIARRYGYEASGTLFEEFSQAFSPRADFKDLLPYASGTVAAYLVAGNSLKVKYENIVKNATCAHWWSQMEASQC